MIRKISLFLFVMLALISFNAYAEWSVGALGGLASYTTKVRGDAIFAYGPVDRPYYQYPADITTSDIALGLFTRYLYPLYPCYSLGVEAGYVWIDQNTTRLRADALFPNPIHVEEFKTRSNGAILLNFIFRVGLTPTVDFSIFGGPAWLDTQYQANDFFDGVVRNKESEYKLTADVGVETEWYFYRCWSAGMRFDYIFDTDNRTVASRGSLGTALRVNNTASSSAILFTGTLKYIIPYF